MINKLICKYKGHNYTYTHVEPDGWGMFWYWKKCERCDHHTYDKSEVGSVNAQSIEMIGKPIVAADGVLTKGRVVCGECQYFFQVELDSRGQKYEHPDVQCPDCKVINFIKEI